MNAKNIRAKVKIARKDHAMTSSAIPDFMKPIVEKTDDDGLNTRDREVIARTNSHQPKHKLKVSYSAYRAKLASLSDEDFGREAEQKIWLSAYASNNPKSDYHWQCDVCYDEAVRRGGESAPLYSAAHKRASGH